MANRQKSNSPSVSGLLHGCPQTRCTVCFQSTVASYEHAQDQLVNPSWQRSTLIPKQLCSRCPFSVFWASLEPGSRLDGIRHRFIGDVQQTDFLLHWGRFSDHDRNQTWNAGKPIIHLPSHMEIGTLQKLKHGTIVITTTTTTTIIISIIITIISVNRFSLATRLP